MSWFDADPAVNTPIVQTLNGDARRAPPIGWP